MDNKEMMRIIRRNFDDGAYTIVAKECVGLIEQVLRQLVRENLTKLSEKDRTKFQNAEKRKAGKMSWTKNKGYEDFTMGQLVHLFRESNFLESWARAIGKDLSSIRIIDLFGLTSLRNAFIHTPREATRAEADLLIKDLQLMVETFKLEAFDPTSFKNGKTSYPHPPPDEIMRGPKKRILVLAANPEGTEQLRLDKEVEEIDQGVRRSQLPNKLELKQHWAPRVRDIQNAMLEFKPHIVHFCGHGKGEVGIVLEDDAGKSWIVGTEAIAELFELFAKHVECVVLNACYSEVQAEAIARHIEYVIGMTQSISDKAAIEFAIAFYNAVRDDPEDFEFAYRLGCNAIHLSGVPEHLTPALIVKGEKPDISIQGTKKGLEVITGTITEEPPEPIIELDPPCIQTFLTKRMSLNLQGFCFVLQHRLKPIFAHQSLAGSTPAEKSISLVNQAQASGDLGEVAYHLVQYWLEEIHGRPRILVREGIVQQLKAYRQELLEDGEQDKAQEALELLDKPGMK